MEISIMDILMDYCKTQGIELRNKQEVANEINTVLNENVIPNVVHEMGDLIEEE